MSRRRLVRDLGTMTSWLLLVAATASIVTGIVAHAWDLNGFGLHTVSGYVMAVAALVHVALSWQRLVAYSSMRLRHARRGLRGLRPVADAGSRPAHAAQRGRVRTAPAGPADGAADPRVTRRGLLGAGAAAAAGVVAGRGLRPQPVIERGTDVGFVYHEWSKPGVIDALGTVVDWGGQPEPYRTHPDRPSLVLPPPVTTGGPTLRETVTSRHSTREYRGGMDLGTLSSLLALTAGLRPGEDRRRTAPSSGALFPIEVYPVVNDVDGLDQGVYHYDVRRHALTTLRTDDVRGRIRAGGLDQDFLGTADVVLVLTMIFQRMRHRYRDRSYRYGLLEAGHYGQTLYLAAGSLGLGACAVGAFRDDDVNDLLGVDGHDEVAVYLLATGTPEGAST